MTEEEVDFISKQEKLFMLCSEGTNGDLEETIELMRWNDLTPRHIDKVINLEKIELGFNDVDVDTIEPYILKLIEEIKLKCVKVVNLEKERLFRR